MKRRRTSHRQSSACPDGLEHYHYSERAIEMLAPAAQRSPTPRERELVGLTPAQTAALNVLLDTLARLGRIARQRYREALLAYNDDPCSLARREQVVAAREQDTKVLNVVADVDRFLAAADGPSDEATLAAFLASLDRRIALLDQAAAVSAAVSLAIANVRAWMSGS